MKYFIKFIARAGLLAGLFVALAATEARAQRVTVKLGTVAPERSPWFNSVKRIAQRWEEASDGKVKLKIYAGGVAGDEEDMLRKIKIGQLHAATITGVGLSQVAESTIALQIPMLMQSYAELDYVRSKLKDRLEEDLAEAGFIVLNWGDAGWVHFFSKVPAETPADYRDLKIMVGAKDATAATAWKQAGFNPVPIAATDVLQGLQTGLVDAFAVPPIFALSSQWFGLAQHMVPVKWSPLNGATVISKRRWEKIPADLRAELMKIAEEEGEKSKEEVRQLGDKAVEAMVERGLTVHELSEAELAQWKQAAEDAYGAVRGKVVPADLFDRVRELAAEYRAQNP